MLKKDYINWTNLKNEKENIMDFSPPKATEVIAAIQKMVAEHGDLPLALDDPDTGWIMQIGLIFNSVAQVEMILITGDYCGNPDGCIQSQSNN